MLTPYGGLTWNKSPNYKYVTVVYQPSSAFSVNFSFLLIFSSSISGTQETGASDWDQQEIYSVVEHLVNAI